MPRHKDVDWTLKEGRPEGSNTVHEWPSIHAALLMDIRDRLNVLLCPDFQDIPRRLRSIDKRLCVLERKARRTMPTLVKRKTA